MKPKIIKKGDFSLWIEELIKHGPVVGVQEKEAGKFHFAGLTNAGSLRLDYDVTVTPPKKFVQPPKETLLKFNSATNKGEAVIEASDLTVIGVHPYDMRAINQMDKAFTDDNRDTNYLTRRERVAIIGVDPMSASKWAFWGDMDSATVETGFDLWLTDIGDGYFVKIGTKKGEQLLKFAKTSNADDEAIAHKKDVQDNLARLCKSERKLNAKGSALKPLFDSSYDNHIWEERAEKCYSCGSCNLVCPTCYCFDVREEVDLDLKTGRRVRTWDGCLLEDFASVGSGENFREEREERFRHRLLRKMTYMVDKIGETACVGCGRCSSVCLPDITDPVKIINELKEGK
jgi:NAD-dependent dihydropyrimidine dehydrogenase PreA subunit